MIIERLEVILGNLGLDGATAEAFAYLADKKKATMEELYEDTALSRKAISRALAALEAEGAVRRDREYFAIDNVREALMALLPARCEELKAEVYSYRPISAEKVRPGVDAARYDASEVSEFVAKNIDAALSTVDIVSGSLAWLNDQSLGAARTAVQRGVIVRALTFEHRALKAEARALADAGVEVRSNRYSTDKELIAVDGELVALNINEPQGIVEPLHFWLLIKDKNVCEKVLKHIFEPARNGAEVV